MLLRTFTTDQDLGKYVKTLCWTILDTSEMTWGQAPYVGSDLEEASDASQEPSPYAPEDGESCDPCVLYQDLKSCQNLHGKCSGVLLMSRWWISAG